MFFSTLARFACALAFVASGAQAGGDDAAMKTMNKAISAAADGDKKAATKLMNKAVNEVSKSGTLTKEQKDLIKQQQKAMGLGGGMGTGTKIALWVGGVILVLGVIAAIMCFVNKKKNDATASARAAIDSDSEDNV